MKNKENGLKMIVDNLPNGASPPPRHASLRVCQRKTGREDLLFSTRSFGFDHCRNRSAGECRGEVPLRCLRQVIGYPRFTKEGEGEVGSGGDVSNPYRYTGRWYDDETGLYYYRNRYYSPELGRFVTRDPLKYIDGPNMYSYVDNDPMNWLDPMGTFEIGSHIAGKMNIHEHMTEIAADFAGINGTAKEAMIEGTRWNDIPEGLSTFAIVFKTGKRSLGPLTYDSHFGNKQHWHSMKFDDESNNEVLEKVINQAEGWYKNSISEKKKASTLGYGSELGQERLADSGFYLGHILHMIQDSYSEGHTRRDAMGVAEFYNYSEQNHDEHSGKDKVLDHRAVNASYKIISLWKRNAGWGDLEDLLLSDIY